MPRDKATPAHITVLAARRRRERARARDRDRRTADTETAEPAAAATTAITLPSATVRLCRHCGDELPEEGSFRGFCGMGCAGDAGYLKSYRDD
jgi:hypothetical protein